MIMKCDILSRHLYVDVKEIEGWCHRYYMTGFYFPDFISDRVRCLNIDITDQVGY